MSGTTRARSARSRRGPRSRADGAARSARPIARRRAPGRRSARSTRPARTSWRAARGATPAACAVDRRPGGTIAPFASRTARWRTAPSPTQSRPAAGTPSGFTAAGPGTKTSPRRASITGSASSSAAASASSVETPAPSMSEREREPARDGDTDSRAREAARPRSDDERLDVPRSARPLAEERVDVLEQRRCARRPLADDLAVRDQGAGGDVSRGVERQDQHSTALVAALPRPQRR